MFRGIDAAASGMIALQRKQDTLTNNVANLNTPGYKQDVSVLRAFPEMLLESLNDPQGSFKPLSYPKIGTLQTGVYNQETLPIFSQGDLVSTRLPFDAAIEDKDLPAVSINGRSVKPVAFFAVQTSDGAFHVTRNGRFTVNENGELTTSSGALVLDKNGKPLSHPELASGDISIQENGDILLHPNDAARTQKIGSIGIVVVNNPNELVKEGNDLFHLEGGNPSMIQANNPNSVKLHHKMIEQANVDIPQAMSDMMMNVRLYEANQKVLQAYDKTLEQLNTIGRV
jgi:flagellar basal-body rod protein FlgF